MVLLSRFVRGLTVCAALLIVAHLLAPSPALSAGKGDGADGLGFESSAREQAPALDHPLQVLETASSGEQENLKVTLKELSGGKEVLLLHFWATWCAPCQKELPDLVRFNKKYGAKGVRVVAIALDNRDKVLKYLEENGINLPVYLDQYGKIMRAYGVGALPVTVVIDKDYLVAARYLGARDWGSGAQQRMIDALIEKE
ncbi:MAG: TlpA family protein disulfide reductase [Proteobacteria bacterium]|nr:TlpA family protein disulfide reductase [Pseudomonadota bacterium]